MLPDTFRRAKRPVVLAHRGASAERPENTASAFELALEQGADGVELDVQRCASGELVVVHDVELSRLAGQPVRVAKTPWAVLKGLDVGSWFHPRFVGTRLLQLSEALECLGPDALVNVELKGEGRGDPLLPPRAAGVLDAAGGPERFLVSSFNPFLLRGFQEVARRLPPVRRPAAALLFEPGHLTSWAPVEVAKRLHLQALNPARQLCRARRMSAWVQEGYAVIPWTVDEPAAAMTLWEAGATGIITNRPRELLEALEPLRTSVPATPTAHTARR
jgi:glycerophosphoryl diester phosphodiesterase